MKPIGPLMREHRLIERMIALLDDRLKRIAADKLVDVDFLMTTIDFIRTYADRTHHGKEEFILFRDLAKKQLAPEHVKTMKELIEEHVFARKTTGRLAAAREEYIKGNERAIDEIMSTMKTLVEFYPTHIEKEDNHFFYPSLDYFSQKEQDAMLEEFWEFDKTLIHEKYGQTIEALEKEIG